MSYIEEMLYLDILKKKKKICQYKFILIKFFCIQATMRIIRIITEMQILLQKSKWIVVFDWDLYR